MLVCPGTSVDAALGCGLNPNPTPVNELSIYLNKANVSDLEVFKLIVGVPLGSASAPAPGAPAITQVVVYNPYVPLDPTPATYPNDVSASFCGWLSPGEANAYGECGFSDVNSGGNSFANWSAADQELGVNPAKFALYAYDLGYVEDLGNKGLYDVFFAAPLPIGTIEIAFGQSTNGDMGCYLTSFLNAGQVVPEPSSVLLAGIGLLLVGGGWLKRRRKA